MIQAKTKVTSTIFSTRYRMTSLTVGHYYSKLRKIYLIVWVQTSQTVMITINSKGKLIELLLGTIIQCPWLILLCICFVTYIRIFK